MVVTFNPALSSVRANVAYNKNKKSAPIYFTGLEDSAKGEVKHFNPLSAVRNYASKWSSRLLFVGTMTATVLGGCQKDPIDPPIVKPKVSALVELFEAAKYRPSEKSDMATTDGAIKGDSIVEVTRLTPTSLGDKNATVYAYNNDGTGTMRGYAIGDGCNLKTDEYALTTSADGKAIEGVASDGTKIRNYVKNDKAYEEIIYSGHTSPSMIWEYVPINDSVTTKTDTLNRISKWVVTRTFKSAKHL